jgi:hypothetical protein
VNGLLTIGDAPQIEGPAGSGTIVRFPKGA